MLAELHVAQLGVIEDLTVKLGRGMTVLTGETGAGKTLIVDAISLLLGGRADPMVVRPGASEATVEGRFVGPGSDGETVVARAVPASGRARAYLNGRMASTQQLADLGGGLVDLHGQHAHQSLLKPSTQRAALDSAAGISTVEVDQARRALRDLASAQLAIGGDARSRARELDLLRFQLAELDSAAVDSADEDEQLRDEEDRLADATALRRAAAAVAEMLGADDGVVDRLGAVVAELSAGAEAAASGRPGPLTVLRERLHALQAELSDAASEARETAESLEDDPDRLAEVGRRRQLLTDLRRKYGDTLSEVLAYRDGIRERITDLESHDERAATLEGRRTEAEAELRAAEERLGALRRAAAPELAAEVQAALQELAMPRASFVIEIGPDPAGEAVTWLLGANPGEPELPLAKAASGGELARTMLAARLALTRRASGPAQPGGDDPVTLVFDEVDAGIGGEAAVAVGRALSALSSEHQVLVVTHLAQVAAFGDTHLVVTKETVGDRTIASAAEVTGPDRVVELSRMLSGRPGSATARRHAEELLAAPRPSAGEVRRPR